MFLESLTSLEYRWSTKLLSLTSSGGGCRFLYLRSSAYLS